MSPESKPSQKNRIIPVLFENEQIMVFDKPAGLIVIPSPKNEAVTLVSEVNAQYAQGAKFGRLHPCHRLDRDTSGCILFAKGKKNQQMMMDLFKRHQINKTYLAFVQGNVKNQKGEIRGFIPGPDRVKYRTSDKGKFAHSTYRVIQRKKQFTIVEVRPITGRTNQIRIQFSRMGHPLLGDRKFSIAKNYPLKFKRTALHAANLRWKNPADHKTISVKSNLPNDMEVFCASN